MGKFISVSGVKRSGKDTFAGFFEKQGYVKINFGDNLKYMLSYAFGIPIECMYDESLKETVLDTPIVITVDHIKKLNEWVKKTHDFVIPDSYAGKTISTPRELMQYVGTDIIRETYGKYHVEATLPKMKANELMICADARFPNEIEGIQKSAEEMGYSFISVYVSRPGFEGDAHSSENSVKPEDCKITVVNDSSIESLLRIAELFLR
jgi:hypothetical protein